MRKEDIKKKKRGRRRCYPGTQTDTDTHKRERERGTSLLRNQIIGGCTPSCSVREYKARAQQQSPTENERQ